MIDTLVMSDVRSESLCFSAESENQSHNTMALLQDVETTTHHEQQEALDLHFDGSENNKTCSE